MKEKEKNIWELESRIYLLHQEIIPRSSNSLLYRNTITPACILLKLIFDRITEGQMCVGGNPVMRLQLVPFNDEWKKKMRNRVL